MEKLLQIAPWIHASIGAICIISGVLALTAKKAKGRHPISGRVFTVSLALTYATILLNIVTDKNVFMLGIGWLAVYAGTEGWRALLRYKGSLATEPKAFDYIFNSITALLSIFLVVFGLRFFISTKGAMGLVCAGFGLLGAMLLRGTWKRWKTPPSTQQWLAIHISMMLGAFSAALTAFLAIQFSGQLGGSEWVIWVAPTLIMSRYGTYETKRRGLDENL